MFMERSIEKGGGKQASDDEMFKMNQKSYKIRIKFMGDLIDREKDPLKK